MRRRGARSLSRYAGHARPAAARYVSIEAAGGQVAGYYTIAAASMPLGDVSAALAKKLPRYPLLPGVRLGRLAVAAVHRGKGLGAALLIDAIERSLRPEIVAFAMVVDAKDETAASFYRHHGFEAFAGAPMNFYLPLGAAARRR